MNRAEYQEYLKSDHWKSIRKDALKFWGDSCAICYGTSGIQVHHRTYERLWSELVSDLIPLCDSCHYHAHWSMKQPDTIKDYRIETCKDCRFFSAGEVDGYCRRYAPRPNLPMEFVGWPQVGCDSWCGEFQKAEAIP